MVASLLFAAPAHAMGHEGGMGGGMPAMGGGGGGF
jgi:hypothetical protein